MTTMSERFAGVTANKTVQAAGETASELTGAAGEKLADVANQAQHLAHEQLDKLAGTIRAKPLQSAGIAAGIGFVLAMLARR